MDENEFMASVIEDMTDDELAAFCDFMIQDINASRGKENNHE